MLWYNIIVARTISRLSLFWRLPSCIYYVFFRGNLNSDAIFLCAYSITYYFPATVKPRWS